MITDAQRHDRQNGLACQIEILGRTNPYVHAALRQNEHGDCSYEEAMQMVVLQLAAVVEAQQKTIFEFIMRQPAPSVIGARP